MTAAAQNTTTEEQSANIENNDEASEVAQTIVNGMTAAGIRSWMSDRGLVRTRGARKMESALEAFEQDPDAARELAEAVTSGRFVVKCPHCGHEEVHADPEAAVDAASSHKSANNTHFPKACDRVAGEVLYG